MPRARSLARARSLVCASADMLGPRCWQLLAHALPALAALDDVAALDGFVGPPSPRGITSEIAAQALGSALLAAVLRCPLGAALLVGWTGAADDVMLALLLLANLVATRVNPRSLIGQPDDEEEDDDDDEHD